MTKAREHETLPGDLTAAEVLEHGWRYFALHAAQRLTLFNYFIALSGLTIAATAATLQGTQRFSMLGVVLGLLLCLLALVFYKLDDRTSVLIKASEAALADAEQRCVPAGSRLFSREINGDRRRGVGGWTYGRSLRLSFAVVGIIGLALATLSLLRANDVVRWEVDIAAESQKTASSVVSKAVRSAPASANIGSNASKVVAPTDDVMRKPR